MYQYLVFGYFNPHSAIRLLPSPSQPYQDISFIFSDQIKHSTFLSFRSVILVSGVQQATEWQPQHQRGGTSERPLRDGAAYTHCVYQGQGDLTAPSESGARGTEGPEQVIPAPGRGSMANL